MALNHNQVVPRMTLQDRTSGQFYARFTVEAFPGEMFRKSLNQLKVKGE
jgi:hypothetical protein